MMYSGKMIPTEKLYRTIICDTYEVSSSNTHTAMLEDNQRVFLYSAGICSSFHKHKNCLKYLQVLEPCFPTLHKLKIDR